MNVKKIDKNTENPQLLSTIVPTDDIALKTEKSPNSEKIPHSISIVVNKYLGSMRDIWQTVQIVMPHLTKWLSEEKKNNIKKMEHFFPEGPLGKDKIKLETARDFAEFLSTVKKMGELNANNAINVLARSLFTQMFCEFDAFMGALLKAIYLQKEDLLKGISREISLTELLEFGDINSAKTAMLEKEIETFRRDSYVEQFNQLEKKFTIVLRKFPEWAEFVELGQRRNLFTHNDGMVSEQYISACKKEDYPFPVFPKIGETLPIDIAYFKRANLVLSKVGFMLAYTLWSKALPGQLETFHESVNDTIYRCLEGKRWVTASELGNFAITTPMKKDSTEILLRVRVINCAIALKFCDRSAESNALLKSFDWTASYRDFKLAILVLEDKFEEAVRVMESIGKSGELITQDAYHSWPLFHKFRERPDFYVTYEKIYGESYAAKVNAEGDEQRFSLKVIDDQNDQHNGTISDSAPAINPVVKRTRARRSVVKTN